jgi:uncharacterized membrane protein
MGTPTGMEAKPSYFFLFAVIICVGLGSNAMILYLNRLDTAFKSKVNEKVLEKIMTFLSLFLSFTLIYIFSITLNGSFSSPKPLLAAVALLFAFLGNLMNSVKPNNFIGIRTSWTLNNEEIWRKTHHFSAKLWFWTGLVLALIVLFVPVRIGLFLVITGIVAITIISFVYARLLYKKTQSS